MGLKRVSEKEVKSEDMLTVWFNQKVASELAWKRHPYSVEWETRNNLMKNTAYYRERTMIYLDGRSRECPSQKKISKSPATATNAKAAR